MGGIYIALLILIPWFGALVVWFIGDKFEKAEHHTAVFFSVVSAIISLLLLTQVNAKLTFYLPVGSSFGDFRFTADGLGVFLAVIANVVGCLAVIFSVDYMKNEKDIGRYYAMILFFIGTMSGLVLTSNILLMFFFWEITALCSYQLISFFNDQEKSVRGGLTALFITQLGGLGLMLGAFLIYSTTKTLDIENFIEAAKGGLIDPTLLAIAGFGCIIAAAAKSSQFPFHTWLPDAMEAPTPVSALIHAATMVNAGVYLLCRFYPAFESVPGWKMTIIIIGLITILLTSIMAIYANDLKRVLAFSTVSQLGFLFVAIGAGSVLASQFHLMSHSIFKALLFLCAGSIIHSCGTRDMRVMGGFFKKMPIVGTCFIIGAAALAGVPPVNGFWSKEVLLEAVHAGAPSWVYVLMVFAVILTALYTIRCVWLVFFGKPRDKKLKTHDAGNWMRISLILLAAGTCLSWLLFGKFSEMLANNLPLHGIEAESTGAMIGTILTDPLTYLAIAMVLLGFLLWFLRKQLSGVSNAFCWLQKAAVNDFGFEDVNTGVVKGMRFLSDRFLDLQTGSLNRNIAGILWGLILVIIILVIGG